jgi:hypothetical protein
LFIECVKAWLMHRVVMSMFRKFRAGSVVLAVVGLLAGGAEIAAQVAERTATPVVAPQEPEVGSVDARVEIAALPGVVPGPGMPPPGPWVIGPAAGAIVQAFDPQAPDIPLAERTADDNGQVSFDLAPGRYWLVVPWSDAVPGQPGAPPVGVALPNGRVVLAWTDASVSSSTTTTGSSVPVPLTIAVALP